MKKLESDLRAKSLEIKSYKAYRLPKVDLVAQYALLAKFNNLHRISSSASSSNNVELGASFSIPILAGKSSKAYISSSRNRCCEDSRANHANPLAHSDDIENAFDDFGSPMRARKLALEYLNVTRDSTTQDLVAHERRVGAASAGGAGSRRGTAEVAGLL